MTARDKKRSGDREPRAAVTSEARRAQHRTNEFQKHLLDHATLNARDASEAYHPLGLIKLFAVLLFKTARRTEIVSHVCVLEMTA